MPINYQQTNTNSGLNSGFCSGVGAIVNIEPVSTFGGTPGSIEDTMFCASSETLVRMVNKIIIDSGTSWDSGTWTWRFNVTTANMNITLRSVYICRVNSSGVNQATIGSSTGLSVSLGTTGVKSGTISGSAQTPNAGDYVVIVYVTENGAMSTQSAGVTPDQLTDSPFSVVSTNLLQFCIAPQPTR